MSYRLLIFPDPLDSLCQLLHDTGFSLTAHPDTHSTGRPGQAFTIPDNQPNGTPIPQGFGCLLTLTHSGKVSIEQKGKLWVKRDDIQYPWEPEQTAALDVDDFRLKDAATTPVPGNTVGCHNHLLTEPQLWFYDHIKRQPGMLANDYVQVLLASGIPHGNLPGEKPNYNNGVFGITQQMRIVNGNPVPAGRLFLPTAIPDSNGYYAQANDFLADAVGGGLQWANFIYKDGHPYAPGPCDV